MGSYEPGEVALVVLRQLADKIEREALATRDLAVEVLDHTSATQTQKMLVRMQAARLLAHIAEFRREFHLGGNTGEATVQAAEESMSAPFPDVGDDRHLCTVISIKRGQG